MSEFIDQNKNIEEGNDIILTNIENMNREDDNNNNNKEKEENDDNNIDFELLKNIDNIIENDENESHNNIILPIPPTANLRAHIDSVYSVSIVIYMNTFMILSGGIDDKAYLWVMQQDIDHNNIWINYELLNHSDTIIDTRFHPLLIKKLEKINGNINKNDENNELYDRPIIGHEKLCMTFCYDGIIRIYQIPDIDNTISLDDSLTLEPLRELSGQDSIESIAIHYLGDLVATGSEDTTIWLWNIRKNKNNCEQVLIGHEANVTCLTFAGQNERLLISGSEDFTIRIWGIKKGVCLHIFQDPHFFHDAPITSLSTRNTFELLSTAMDGTICLSNLKTKKILGKFIHSITKSMQKNMQTKIISSNESKMNNEEEGDDNVYSVESVVFSINNWFASAGIDGKLKIWDLDNNTKQCRLIINHEGAITKIRHHPTYPCIYTTCADGFLRCWDIRNGNLIQSFRGHNDIILTMDIIFDFDVTLLNFDLINNDEDVDNDQDNEKNDEKGDDEKNDEKGNDENDDDNININNQQIDEQIASTKLDIIITGGDDNEVFIWTFDPSNYFNN